MKKMLSLILALVLVLGLAANVWAEETTEEPQIVATGNIEVCKWTLYDDGNLLLDGNLIVSEYAVPWRNYAEQITRVSLKGAAFATRLLDDLPNLTTVYCLNNTVCKVQGCFKNCPKFTAFIREKDGKEFSCRDGYILRYETSLYRAPTGISGKVVVPEYVIDLWDRAFINCAYIEEVVFQEGFESVGIGAFENCTGLKTVVFPNSLRKLSGQIFVGCTGLESIYFTGDAPTAGMEAVNYGGPPFGDYRDNHRIPADTRITANVYYPADNETWTEEVREAFGGLVTWIPYNPANPFRDVPVDAFYEEPVLWALENNITSGATATTFNPGGECLRAQVVTFLWRAAGCPMPTDAENPFEDVEESDYYYNAVLWAVEQGITAGVDATHFAPTQSCSRAQVVAFLHRAMGSPQVSAESSPFTDVETGEWYELPVLWAVENGITAGLTPDTFGVNTVCNRAQVVTFLYRTYVN